MRLAARFQETDDVVGIIRGKQVPVSDPGRRPPLEAIQDHIRIALQGPLHQPPFVSPVRIIVAPRAHVTGFDAARDCRIAPDLDFEVLQRSPELRLEKEIQYLGLLPRRIIQQQPAGTAGAERSQALEEASAPSGIEPDPERLIRRGMRRRFGSPRGTGSQPGQAGGEREEHQFGHHEKIFVHCLFDPVPTLASAHRTEATPKRPMALCRAAMRAGTTPDRSD